VTDPLQNSDQFVTKSNRTKLLNSRKLVAKTMLICDYVTWRRNLVATGKDYCATIL